MLRRQCRSFEIILHLLILSLNSSQIRAFLSYTLLTEKVFLIVESSPVLCIFNIRVCVLSESWLFWIRISFYSPVKRLSELYIIFLIIESIYSLSYGKFINIFDTLITENLIFNLRIALRPCDISNALLKLLLLH